MIVCVTCQSRNSKLLTCFSQICRAGWKPQSCYFPTFLLEGRQERSVLLELTLHFQLKLEQIYDLNYLTFRKNEQIIPGMSLWKHNAHSIEHWIRLIKTSSWMNQMILASKCKLFIYDNLLLSRNSVSGNNINMSVKLLKTDLFEY